MPSLLLSSWNKQPRQERTDKNQMLRFVRRGPVDGTIRGVIRCRGEDRRRYNFGGTRRE
ncbi:unnamed protein product [Ectocarpus sp. 8 AP-2014]